MPYPPLQPVASHRRCNSPCLFPNASSSFSQSSSAAQISPAPPLSIAIPKPAIEHNHQVNHHHSSKSRRRPSPLYPVWSRHPHRGSIATSPASLPSLSPHHSSPPPTTTQEPVLISAAPRVQAAPVLSLSTVPSQSFRRRCSSSSSPATQSRHHHCRCAQKPASLSTEIPSRAHLSASLFFFPMEFSQPSSFI